MIRPTLILKRHAENPATAIAATFATRLKSWKSISSSNSESSGSNLARVPFAPEIQP